ncbi:MAG: hypothetical protein ACRD0W_00090 [Acidimicrobiales bacterium]
MSTRIFLPQPIPEVAVERLKRLAEVTVNPHTDRRIARAELLGAVVDKPLDVYENEVPEVDVPGPSERFKTLPNVFLAVAESEAFPCRSAPTGCR